MSTGKKCEICDLKFVKRTTRIVILLLIVASAVLIMLSGGVSATFSRFATREVNKFLATLPDVQASCADIRISLVTGTTAVSGVELVYDAEPVGRSAKHRGMKVSVERMEVEHVFYIIRNSKRLTVNSVRVIRPEVELWMDENHPQACLPPFMRDTMREPLHLPLEQVIVKSALLDGASVHLPGLYVRLRTKDGEIE